MERAWKVEENGITRLKLTREGAKSLPPFPRPPRGKVGHSEGEEGVLSGAEDRERGGVSRRCSRIGQLGRWSHGATTRGTERAERRGDVRLCFVRRDARRKTQLTRGPTVSARKGTARDHAERIDTGRWIQIQRSTLCTRFYNLAKR